MRCQILFSPLEIICIKCQILFSGENNEHILKCCLLKILPRVLSIKGPVTTVANGILKYFFYSFQETSFIFPNKYDLTFHLICLLGITGQALIYWKNKSGGKNSADILKYFSQKIGFDILCKLSHKERIYMKGQILFLE